MMVSLSARDVLTFPAQFIIDFALVTQSRLFHLTTRYEFVTHLLNLVCCTVQSLWRMIMTLDNDTAQALGAFLSSSALVIVALDREIAQQMMVQIKSNSYQHSHRRVPLELRSVLPTLDQQMHPS